MDHCVEEYARQSAYTDPGRYAHLLDRLPTDLRELTGVVRNQVVHYRGDPEVSLPADRMPEIDLRWLDRRLAADQRRFGQPLADPRPKPDRVAGCCRDFALLTVAALRHRGVPARSRVGFAGYFSPDWHHDHVVAEYWNGERWVWVDAQLEQGSDWPPFDPCDLPRPADATEPGRSATAAQVWTAYRRDEVDADRYGVDPGLPFKGHGFVRDEVLWQLAHRRRDELLLWDVWGVMLSDLDGEPEPGLEELVDEVAAPRLHPVERVRCLSPTGAQTWVELR